MGRLELENCWRVWGLDKKTGEIIDLDVYKKHLRAVKNPDPTLRGSMGGHTEWTNQGHSNTSPTERQIWEFLGYKMEDLDTTIQRPD